MLDKIKKEVQHCCACDLHKTRNNVVFSDGSSSAKIILIGEAPGENEDKTGLPFVGRAGKLLDEILIRAKVDRQKDLYIINTLKCRPPQNRKPTKEEKKSCEKYLKAQIDFVKPKVILLCGSTSLESFLDKSLKISKSRGQIFEKDGIKFIPIFHPSYLLRFHSWDKDSNRDLTINDLKLAKKEAYSFS